MKILLSNDDGIYSPLYRSLYAALLAAGHDVKAVAPQTEHSGASCSATTHQPLQAIEVLEPDFEGYAVQGTPADCVLLALGGLFPDDYKPDVVMSGINRGPNAGLDVLFSGTVGAAMQAALNDIPAVAVSSCRVSSNNRDQAREAVSLMERLDFGALPNNVVYNLNFPDCEVADIQGLKVCPIHNVWNPFGPYIERRSPHNRPYWWIGDMNAHVSADGPGADRGWLKRGYSTLTPLRYDPTEYQLLDALRYLEK